MAGLSDYLYSGSTRDDKANRDLIAAEKKIRDAEREQKREQRKLEKNPGRYFQEGGTTGESPLLDNPATRATGRSIMEGAKTVARKTLGPTMARQQEGMRALDAAEAMPESLPNPSGVTQSDVVETPRAREQQKRTVDDPARLLDEGILEVPNASRTAATMARGARSRARAAAPQGRTLAEGGVEFPEGTEPGALMEQANEEAAVDKAVDSMTPKERSAIIARALMTMGASMMTGNMANAGKGIIAGLNAYDKLNALKQARKDRMEKLRIDREQAQQKMQFQAIQQERSLAFEQRKMEMAERMHELKEMQIQAQEARAAASAQRAAVKAQLDMQKAAAGGGGRDFSGAVGDVIGLTEQFMEAGMSYDEAQKQVTKIMMMSKGKDPFAPPDDPFGLMQQGSGPSATEQGNAAVGQVLGP